MCVCVCVCVFVWVCVGLCVSQSVSQHSTIVLCVSEWVSQSSQYHCLRGVRWQDTPASGSPSPAQLQLHTLTYQRITTFLYTATNKKKGEQGVSYYSATLECLLSTVWPRAFKGRSLKHTTWAWRSKFDSLVRDKHHLSRGWSGREANTPLRRIRPMEPR